MTTLAGENGFHKSSYANAETTENGDKNNEVIELNKVQEEPVQLDIVINNVVCSFSVRCHLNLRQIALQAANVEYRREHGMVTMKLRKPYTTASVWSSGKITCTGATSEDLSKVAARRFARLLQKLGFRVRFSNYRVVNVLGTCTMPFAIRITDFSRDHREASYEPELHPGVTYKIKDPKATLKIFSTGSITITAPSVNNVQAAVEHIFPMVYQYRRNPQERGGSGGGVGGGGGDEGKNLGFTTNSVVTKSRKQQFNSYKNSSKKKVKRLTTGCGGGDTGEIDEEFDISEEDDEDLDSDKSWD